MRLESIIEGSERVPWVKISGREEGEEGRNRSEEDGNEKKEMMVKSIVEGSGRVPWVCRFKNLQPRTRPALPDICPE